MVCSGSVAFASEVKAQAADDLSEHSDINAISTKPSCYDKLQIIHTQENGITLSTEINNIINIPMKVVYQGDYESVEISITSTDNITIISNDFITIEKNYIDAPLEYSFIIQVNIACENNITLKTVNDVGMINVSCSITNESENIVSSSILLNVLISPEAIVIGEYGIDTVELYYYNWLKNEALVNEEEYEEFLNNYHSVDYIIENGITTVNERAISANRFYEKLIDQRFQIAPSKSGISTLAFGSENASTTTAAASSVYVQYSIIVQDSGKTLSVSGKVIWKDTDNAEHPVKNAYVEIVDEDIAFDDMQARVYTNNTGDFSATFANQIGWNEKGCDIFFRIFAQNTKVKVQAMNSSTEGGYFFRTKTDKDINSSIINKIQGITNTDVAKSFSVMQALNEGINYANAIDPSETYRAYASFPAVSIIGTSCYGLKSLYILNDDYCDWDVILHEFGHYIADTIDIDNSPGGDHKSSDDLIDTAGSKSKAIRLAWSEGWATYFSIASQRYLSLGGIPSVGDYNYTDTIDRSIDYDLRTPKGIGEANERDISYMLIMLNDYYNSQTGINGYEYIWNVAKDSGCKTFSEFYNALISRSENRNYTRLRQIGIYAESAKISPSATLTNGNSTKCPTFTIQTVGNSTKCSHSYSLHFADFSLNSRLDFYPASKTSYTLSPEEWNNLMTIYPNGFVWWASVDCDSSPLTGSYYSKLYQYHYVSSPDISLNETRSGTLSSTPAFTSTDGTSVSAMTNTVWYKFTVPFTADYIFESYGSVDTYGELFSRIVPDGTTYDRIAYNDDSGSGRNFFIKHNLEKGDVIYVRVRGYGSTSTGAFSFKISIDATTLDTANPQSNTLNAGKCYCYSFTPTSSGYYTICSLGNIDTVCEMYLFDGTYEGRDVSSGVSNNFSITRYLNSGITYYFMVCGRNISTNGSYTIYAVPIENINVNNSSVATIDSDGSMWYKFEAPYPGTYSFYTTASFDSYGSIYSEINPAGDHTSLLAENDDESGSNWDFKISYYLTTGQTIYIQVKGWDSDEYGIFEFFVDYIPTTMTLNEGYTAYIRNGNELWYSFTAPTTAYYVFHTTGDIDTYGELYNTFLFGGSTSDRVAYNDDSGIQNNCEIIYQLNAGQTIYFRVRGYSTSSYGFPTACVTQYLVANFLIDYTLTINSGETYWYKFTAPDDATYTFIVRTSEDVYINLARYYYYEDLSRNDEFYRMNQKQVKYRMTKGETLYFYVSAGKNIENLTVNVKVTIPSG